MRTWRYHAEHVPKIVEIESEEEVKALEADGWYDTPAKCTGFLDKVGANPNNALQVQYVGEVVEQTTEILNLLENIDELDKPGLLRLVKLRFNEDWAKRRSSVDTMRVAIKKRIADESESTG